MPGIFGFQFKKNSTQGNTNKLIDAMSSSLMHIDTYSHKTFTSKNMGIGIIGIKGKSDVTIYKNHLTGIVVALFGDIFSISTANNSIVSSNNSTHEKIAALYMQYGSKIPSMINGDYNIAIYDPKKEIINLFNDRFGYRLLYTYEDDSINMFSPEIKSFLCYSSFDKSLDEQGVSDYFNYFYHLGDRTMFQKVNLLPPATFTTFNVKKKIVHSYWSPQYTQSRNLSHLDESIETGYQLFLNSMQRRVNNKNNLLIPLSGGLDSRLILAVAKDLCPNITVATMGIPGCMDYKIARKVSKSLGITNHHFIHNDPEWMHLHGPSLIHLSEGNYATLLTTRLIGFYKKMGLNYDALLNGIFGGHLSFGPPYFAQEHLNKKCTLSERIRDITQGLNGYRFDIYLKNVSTAKLTDISLTYKIKSIEEELTRAESCSDNPAFQRDFLLLYNRMRRGMNLLDINRFYYNSQLPFASYELFDFYLSLSSHLTVNHYLYKEIYKKKFPSLAKIPWQATGVNLHQNPSSLRNKYNNSKKYFLWYLTSLSLGKINIYDKDLDKHPDLDYRRSNKTRLWVEELILSDRFIDRGFFQKNEIKKLLDYENRGGSVYHEISKLVVFELWASSFLD